MSASEQNRLNSSAPHNDSLITGRDDPLLPHLVAHIANAVQVDIVVAFITTSGVLLVEEHMRDVISRGGRVRVLTGDYNLFTEPGALLRLLDLGPSLELRAYVCDGESFHPKAYLCMTSDGEGTALVGSANLTHMALRLGVEWNYRVVTTRDADGFRNVQREFARIFADPQTVSATVEWIAEYAERRERQPLPISEVSAEPMLVPLPHQIQEEALAALRDTRNAGNTAGLVVLATGLGKTWLSAFDCERVGARRVLFIAHRDEILDQALRTFRAIRPRAILGKYAGIERSLHADVTFASIQTLSRSAHLNRFAPHTFDYVVIDEFHHASAPSYRRLLDHFNPRFLLGLTATPTRTDGSDLLALCGENLVYTCNMARGITRGLLAPFDYYGVPDSVDYANIPWRSGRFDEEELTACVAVVDRAQNALDQLKRRGGSRAIAFCVSQRHADFMRTYSSAQGLRVAAVHSGESSDPRARSLEQLEAGELDVLFAVDMFNEGVDLPNVDTILMLRPTESAVLWLQQFGRGLRYRDGKRLRVIDYIGNHRSFLLKPKSLFQLGEGTTEIVNALRLVDEGRADELLPPGCSVTYDLEAKNILRTLLERDIDRPQALRTYYQDFRERNGVRPSASEAFHDGYDPRSMRTSFGSWLQFVRTMGDLNAAEDEAESRLRGLLSSIETMEVRRSDVLLVALAAIANGSVPGRISLDQLTSRVRALANRSAPMRRDFGAALDGDANLPSRLIAEALPQWSQLKSAANVPLLSVEDSDVVATLGVPAALDEAASALIRELIEWRLAAYLAKAVSYDGAPRFACQLSLVGQQPFLFLPDRDRTAGIPQGWIDVAAEGVLYHANFAARSIDVVQRPGEDDNVLPEIINSWFGDVNANAATTHRVLFERSSDSYLASPIVAEDSLGPKLWQEYARKDVPRLFGFTLSSFDNQMGVVEKPGVTLLFVTLDKSDKQESHQYADKFLSPNRFQWQSQNRTTQDSKSGRRLRDHKEMNVNIHLFVRERAKVRGATQPFVYCGQLQFESWTGEKPITVEWSLSRDVPETLHATLRVP